MTEKVTFIKGAKPAPDDAAASSGNTVAGAGLGLEPTDLCSDPAYADTQYCRLRLPGETVAQFNTRWTREREANPLAVTVRRGIEAAAASPLLLLLVGAVVGVVAWNLWKGRR